MRKFRSRGVALAAGLGLGLTWWVVTAEVESLLLGSGTLYQRLFEASSADVVNRIGIGLLIVGTAFVASEVAALSERRDRNESHLALIRSLFDLTRDPTVAIDRDYRITVANKEAARVSGAQVADIIGQHCYEVMCARTEPCESCDLRGIFADGMPRSAVVRATRDGADVWLEHTWKPLSDGDGEVQAVVETVADITRLKSYEDELESERDKNRTYVEQTLTPMVAVDARGSVVMANPAASELLGLPERWIVGRDWYTEFMPPEDGTVLRRLMSSAIDGKAPLPEKGESHVLSAEAGTRLVAWSASLLRDAEGEAEGLLLSMEDVTEPRRRERELDLKSYVLDQLQDSIILHTVDGIPRYANRAAWEPRGFTHDEFLALRPFGWLPEGAAPSLPAEEIQHRIRHDGAVTFQSSLLDTEGVVVPLEVHARVVEVDGEKLVLSSGRDLTERIESEEKFQKMAFYDELTGLANRALFLDRLRVALAQSARSGRPVAVLFLDIDHFKQVNDTYGHRFGDVVLKAVSARMNESLREYDLLGRIGGEEFLIVCPDTNREGTLDVAERIRKIIKAGEITEGTTTTRMTVSAGVATVSAHDLDVDALFSRADAALYQAKQEGRDRVVAL